MILIFLIQLNVYNVMMKTIVIIIHSPMIHNISHLIDVQEYLIVKQLISHTGIKRLNISILPRTTRLNKFCSLSE